MKPILTKCTRRPIAVKRRGSTLLIVVALLGMLAFLGFVFYTFAKQEKANAQSASQGAKVLKAPSLESDALLDFALLQILLGPPDSYPQSILWGGRHSLLPNAFGRDGIPWNGEGVNLIQDPLVPGQPQVDMNFDLNVSGTNPNDNQYLLNIVDSPAANPVNWAYGPSGVTWGSNKRFRGVGPLNPVQDIPEPDVNYNSPDINSIWLSYDGVAVDANGQNPTRVIIPSFLRPQYLRNGGTPIANWFFNAPANQIMRPHPGHVCVDSSGNPIFLNGSPVPRYVSLAEVDTSVTPNRPLYQSLKLRRPFTTGGFAPDSPGGSPSPGNIGVWYGQNPVGQINGVNQFEYDLDVDTDNDGVLDAILMDLGHPPIRRGDGKLVVPLFAISIRDLNGLLNVNATGNLSGNLNLATLSGNNQLGFRKTGAGTSSPDNLSKSNQAQSTYEINIQRAFTADPSYVGGIFNDPQLASSEAAQQLSYFLKLFDNTITLSPPQPGRSIAELANLEWLMLNIGRANFHLGLANNMVQANLPFQNAISDLFAGRGGEISRLRTFLSSSTLTDQPKPGFSVNWNSGLPNNWPALNPNPDDNNNFNEGEANLNTRWVNPLDFRGSGQQFQRYAWGADGQPGQAGVDDDLNGVIDDFTEEGWPGSDDPLIPLYGKRPELLQMPNSPLFWPSYSGYHSYNGSSVGGVRWGEQQTSPSYFNSLMRGSRWDSLLDDQTESIIDPTLMSSAYVNYLYYLSANPPIPATPLTQPMISATTNAIVNDSVFGPEESLFLQGSASDSRLSETRSRLAEVMPGNLQASQFASDIRKRLTTVSQDRREFGLGISYLNGNYVSGNYTGGIRSWESRNPLFPALDTFPPFSSLGQPNPYRQELFGYLHQATTSGTSSLKLDVNRFLFLDGITGNQYGFAPLPEQTSPTDVNATTARQNMARDIYTLLYTLCHVHTDGTSVDVNYRPNTTIPPTAAQAKEMAQFAVNLVDALDPDNIITAFYYDPDLSDAGQGWNQVYGPDLTQGTPDDTVVYGVERQLLTFSEALALQVKKKPVDSPMTIFDDTVAPAGGANARPYLFFELQNVTPMNVTLASVGVTSGNAATNADWRVRLTDLTEATEYNVLYFLPGLDAANNFVQKQAGSAILPSGALFTVASQDGTDQFSAGSYRTSDFRADLGVDGTFDRIVPTTGVGGTTDTTGGKIVPLAGTPVGQFPTPKCNLDLVWDYGDGPASPTRFVLKNNPAIPGSFVSQLGGKPSVRMILERRAAAGGALGSTWVAVDKTSNTRTGATPDILIGTIDPPIPPPTPITSLMVDDAFKNAVNFYSYPRSVPLLRNSIPTTPIAGKLNTINTASTTAITESKSFVWQMQFDRDFGSLSELMQLPLYGPDQLTSALAQVVDPGDGATSPTLSNGQFHKSTEAVPPATGFGPERYYPTIAAARFLRPDNPDYTLNSVPTNNGNRWHRLLDLLEVPNRSHQHQAIQGISPLGPVTFGAVTGFGTPATFNTQGTPGSTSFSANQNMFAGSFNLPQYFGWPRTQGLINLNTIRHPQVLLALLDDDQLIKDPRFMAATFPFLLDDATGDAARKWWFEFLKSRDSRFISGAAFQPDPGTISPAIPTGLYVPGTANARPFRSIDSVGPVAMNNTTDSPLENTILRSLPIDAATNPNESRRLFEVGNPGEHFGQPNAETGSMPLHPSARYKLMSKLMNNTTTRSNSFAIYITVQYYEAVEVPTGGATAVRIGGRLDDTPTHRGFFVVDRTGAIDQMKTLAANGKFPVSPGSYSFQSNTDRSGVRSNMNGIRWKDLVLYRQTLN